MSGRFIDIKDGLPPTLKWPVAIWKSPKLRVDGTTELYYQSPAPASAYTDMALECLVSDAALYTPGDHARAQRCYIGGGFDFIHPAWDDRRKSHFLACGNLANSYAMSIKTTGIGTFNLTSTNWAQRIYQAWPLLRDGAEYRNLDRKYTASLKGSNIKVLRKKAKTPWNPALTATYDMKNFGHFDEPPILQVWAKCTQTDQGYSVGDEMILLGNDYTTGTGVTVWANNSTVGYTISSNGVSIVDITGAPVALTPSKWIYQVRMAFASDPDDMIDGKQGAKGIVSMHSTQWRNMAAGKMEWQIPQNFEALDIGIGIRCKSSASSAGGWLQNDQVYSRHAGHLNAILVTNIVTRGRRAIIYFATAPSMTNKTGPDGTAMSMGDFEIQLRMIG